MEGYAAYAPQPIDRDDQAPLQTVRYFDRIELKSSRAAAAILASVRFPGLEFFVDEEDACCADWAQLKQSMEKLRLILGRNFEDTTHKATRSWKIHGPHPARLPAFDQHP